MEGGLDNIRSIKLVRNWYITMTQVTWIENYSIYTEAINDGFTNSIFLVHDKI